MELYKTTRSELTGVADAIRDLTGTDQPLSYPFGFVDAINSVEAWPYGECQDVWGSVVSTTLLASRTTLNATFQANASITFASFPLVSSITSSRAFRSCPQLKGASFQILKSIPVLTFALCSQLQAVSFPECETIDYGAFFYCIDMEKAYFPNCLSAMSSSAIGLSVSSNNYFSVSYFSDGYVGAFERAGIVDANFPVLATVATRMFYGCDSLATISFPACTIIAASGFNGCSAITAASFPECSVVGIAAFGSCTALTSISFPNVTSVGNVAFGSVAISVANFPLCQSIGRYAFASCPLLVSAIFPTCTYIDRGAFASCSQLKDVSLPACTVLGFSTVSANMSGTFSACTALQTISLPACTNIGAGAFYGCTALQTVSLPACTDIGSSAFYGCTALQMIRLPVCSVIGTYAFVNCTSLVSLYLLNLSSLTKLSSRAALYSTPFSVSTYTGTFGSIYVPASLLTSYKTATNWTYYSSRFVGLTDEEIAALVQRLHKD